MENEIERAAAERVRLSVRPQTIAGQEALGRVFWQVLPAVKVQDGWSGKCAEAEGPVPGADPVERPRSALPTGLLTFLFTDIEGSTRLVQEIGADKYGDLLAQHSRL